MREHDVKQIHTQVRQEAQSHRADERKLDDARGRAMDRADRREWAQKKFAVGGEFRWKETQSNTLGHGRRRFVYDPKTDRVVEIT